MLTGHGWRAVAQLGFIPRVLFSLGNNREDLGKEIVALSPNFYVRHKRRGNFSKRAHHQRKSWARLVHFLIYCLIYEFLFMLAPYSRTRTQSDREQRTGQEQDVGETTRLQCNIYSLFDGKTEEINLRYTTRRLIVSILLIAVCLLLEPFQSRLINYHFQNSF